MNSGNFESGHTPWNKGLTKDDPRIQNIIDKQSKTKIERYGNAWGNNNMSEEHKEKIAKALTGNTNGKGERDASVGEKISAKKMGHKVDESIRKKISDSKTGKKMDPETLKIKLTKEYLTRKTNNSFNTSKPEQELYESLLKENVNKTIYKQYKDPERYPFYCDFYIVEDDLFIELNAHWTHGGKPFDPDDEDCQKQLAEWQEKAKTSKFYENAIQTWTIRDVKKAKCAKEHSLNYKVIY